MMLPLESRKALEIQTNKQLYHANLLHFVVLNQLSFSFYSVTHLKSVVESVDWDRVDGTDDLQHAVEVVELLENLQNLYDPRQHGHPLLKVHRLYDTPANTKRAQLQI